MTHTKTQQTISEYIIDNMSKIMMLIALFVLSSNLVGQYSIKQRQGLEVADDRVGNIEFHPIGTPLEFPVLDFYDQQPLILKFDIFSTEEEELYYKIELCNFDWTPSELDVTEYIDSYPEVMFYAFSSSFNTTVDYVHYQLKLPNNDIHFLKSGNYIVTIYRADKEEDVLSRRFIVYEPDTEIEIEIDKFQTDLYSEGQALNVLIKPETIGFTELVGNVNLSVIQNANWNQLQTFNKYNADGNGNIAFNTPGQIVFDGMNEYRYFDIKSLKFMSEKIERMDYKPPYNHIYLKPDKLQGDKQYFSKGDLNGDFYIWNQETHDDNLLDAEYVYVHFNLESEIPLGADVYIEGALTDWEIENNFMTFTQEEGKYEAVLLLKQGIYNYRYVTREYNTNLVYCDITEGNHFLTGNDYRAFLYYRELGSFNDRVVGLGRLTTGKLVEKDDKNRELNAVEKILKEIAPR